MLLLPSRLPGVDRNATPLEVTAGLLADDHEQVGVPAMDSATGYAKRAAHVSIRRWTWTRHVQRPVDRDNTWDTGESGGDCARSNERSHRDTPASDHLRPWRVPRSMQPQRYAWNVASDVGMPTTNPACTFRPALRSASEGAAAGAAIDTAHQAKLCDAAVPSIREGLHADVHHDPEDGSLEALPPHE